MVFWFKEYRNSLKAIEIEEFFDLVFYRPLAFLVVKMVYRTNITPNQLTYIALFFGLTAGVFIAWGTPGTFVAGGIAYLLFNVFDCSDGQLARLKHNGTPLGRIIDGVADYLAGIAVYLGISIGFVSRSANPAFWMGLLLAAALSHIVHSMITDYYRQRFTRLGFGEVNDDSDPEASYKEELKRLKESRGSVISITILRIYLSYSVRQKKITGNQIHYKDLLSKVTPSQYYQHNVLMMRFWTFLGPTTQITFLVIMMLLNRPDLYILGMLLGFNTMALLLYLVQRNIDHRMQNQTS